VLSSERFFAKPSAGPHDYIFWLVVAERRIAAGIESIMRYPVSRAPKTERSFNTGPRARELVAKPWGIGSWALVYLCR